MPATLTPPPDKPESLRLVFFGLPNAGKSSLLGALGQAVRTQEALLHGKLDDVSHGLEEQCRRLYEGEARSTAQEIVPYRVQYQPQEGSAMPAVLMDCDGRVANALLTSKELPEADNLQAAQGKGAGGTLVHELRHADTLILVVDAAAPAAQVEADFTEFARFLHLLQEGRGQRVEVAGLPIFVVLTKCDLLAQPGDSNIDWVERIEQRKGEVDARFREVLAKDEAVPRFGRLDLHLWATAVKRPALQGAPARPREPYLVAELFRQCLVQAADHRDRIAQAHQRLVWTAGGAGTLMAALLATLVGLFVARPGEKSPLQLHVEDLMFADGGTPAERLRGKPADLRERLSQLTEVRQDPGFDALPARHRNFVTDRSEELTEYLAYVERLRQGRRPADAVREETVREIQEQLAASLALPHEDWAATEAGRVRQERIDECAALLGAVRKTRDWYLDSAEQIRDLTAFMGFEGTAEAPGINWRPWLDEVDNMLGPVRAAPFTDNEPLPGAATLSYGSVLRFDSVVEARAEWQSMRQKLERVRDVCAAVGLVTGVKDKSPVLLIPRSGFTLEAARERLRELQTVYPTYRVDFVRAGLPDALLPELARAALTSYEYALEPARAAVLRQLKQAGGGTEETVARWGPVRTWLAEPEELASWRVLALTLARLHDAEAVDPVTALAAFLQKTTFEMEIKKAVLEVPDAVKVKPAFEASLAIYHPRSSPGKPALVYRMDGAGEHVGQERLWRYRFQVQDGGTLSYRPGDELWARLPLRDDLTFTWSRCRSSLYQFERLQRPPRLEKAGEDFAASPLLDKVRLTLTPTNGVPAVPDLMPNVDLK